MLNYIWLALIALGIAAALTIDITEKAENRYRNGEALPVELVFGSDADTAGQVSGDAALIIPAGKFSGFYGEILNDDIMQNVKLSYDGKSNGYNIFFTVSSSSPSIWKEMAKVSGKDDDLTGSIKISKWKDARTAEAVMTLESISFAKMKEVTNSAIDYAGTAVNIALGLIGIMALWLGVMKIAEESGMIKMIARSVKPVTRFLFPEVPQDHPAMGSMIMNISANMLGLGNAATPFGLKAMEELEKINPEKGTASNAMCTFLAVNTAGLTLIPATAIAIRAASGSSDPAIIIGTSFFGASCATIAGITAAKVLEKFPMSFPQFKNYVSSNLRAISVFFSLIFLVILFAATGIWSAIFSALGFINAETLKQIIQIISILAIPLIIFIFVVYGAFKKIKIYETFVEGAKEGFNIAVRIIPFLVAMLVAIGIFRAGGAMNFLVMALQPVTNLIGMPAEALPMALMRPLSGSGSLGIMAEIIKVHGPDSFIGILVSTIMGSTETTFYVIALYFGSVSIRKTRHALAAGLIADAAGMLGALYIVKLLFG